MERPNTTVLQAPAASAFVPGLGPAMQAFDEMVSEVARTDIPVLLVGESGTGKDAYARQIHRSSQKNELRFQKFNCASFDFGMLLRQSRQSGSSLLTDDSCGTLYLDNVQELDLSAQRALLSCLPDKEDPESGFEHVGRLVSSATASLESEGKLSHIRRELYFRLNGACLRIPPLRERMEDIPVLTEHFLNKHSTALKKSAPQLTAAVNRALSEYAWPGNIRELENLARNAVLFGDFQIALNELQSTTAETSNRAAVASCSSLKMAARAASEKAERELILQALERTHWNRKRAARELQISYKSLLYKIKQIGVSNAGHES